MWRPGSSTILRFAAVAVAVAATLALAELAMRALPSGVVAEADLFRLEDGLLLLRPGIVRRHVTPFWDVTIKIDEAGLRDSGRPAAPGETVVLGLGDSLAFGWGVELEETFYARLEVDAAVRLINASVPGTGTADQARMLERLMPGSAPRAVLLSLFVGNDFVDVARGGSAQYAVADGFLTHTAPAGDLQGGLRRLAVHSRLLQLLRTAQFRLGASAAPRRYWDEWMREYAEVHLRAPPGRTRSAVAQTSAALERLDEHCRRAGIPWLLIVLPRSYQVDAGEREEMLRALGWRPEELDLDRPQRLVAAWGQERAVDVVDVLPAFRAHAASGGSALFFTPDAHMTAEGHRVVAEAVRPALDRLLRAAQ